MGGGGGCALHLCSACVCVQFSNFALLCVHSSLRCAVLCACVRVYRRGGMLSDLTFADQNERYLDKEKTLVNYSKLLVQYSMMTKLHDCVQK